ncbi:type II toxin-antitoxin system HicA family toxin [Clostridioides sp. ZZV14-6009]|uniref:type II toxin-antitoxin system HicA family toxin n=1 Tax=Clostridioides sp. ZZV14-6009 TaxID=2811487 RepID=UPI001D121D52|nr:type II toxin-antitoxin system HicA family toxin [Clostridioides sp. ZZV14-6009]
MKSYSSREILKILNADGWYEVNCVGGHQHNLNKQGLILVNPSLLTKTLRS